MGLISESFMIKAWRKRDRYWCDTLTLLPLWPLCFCLPKLMLCLQRSSYSERYRRWWPFSVGMCLSPDLWFCTVLWASTDRFLYIGCVTENYIKCCVGKVSKWYTDVLNPLSEWVISTHRKANWVLLSSSIINWTEGKSHGTAVFVQLRPDFDLRISALLILCISGLLILRISLLRIAAIYKICVSHYSVSQCY